MLLRLEVELWRLYFKIIFRGRLVFFRCYQAKKSSNNSKSFAIFIWWLKTWKRRLTVTFFTGKNKKKFFHSTPNRKITKNSNQTSTHHACTSNSIGRRHVRDQCNSAQNSITSAFSQVSLLLWKVSFLLTQLFHVCLNQGIATDDFCCPNNQIICHRFLKSRRIWYEKKKKKKKRGK
jgi:hypothetical protein